MLNAHPKSPLKMKHNRLDEGKGEDALERTTKFIIDPLDLTYIRTN